MLLMAQSVVRQGEALHLQVPQMAGFFEAWQIKGRMQAADAAVSLRFAIGKQGQSTVLVLGVRREGRGFDIGIPRAFWDELSAAPETLLLTDPAESKETGAPRELIVEFPNETLEEFLESVRLQAEEFPERTAVAEVAAYFYAEGAE